jgi:hypothetical protein
MGIVIGGIMNVSFWWFSGSFTLMIAHRLFCLADISCERSGNRSFLNWCACVCVCGMAITVTTVRYQQTTVS